MDNLATDAFSRDNCPVVKSLEQLGDKWVLLILRECFFGYKRFEDFQQNLHISRSVLSSKLQHMLELDLLKKSPYQQEGDRSRFEYRLTRKGKGLIKVIIALMEWGNEHIVNPGEKTLKVIDHQSDSQVQVGLSNKEGDSVPLRQMRLRIIENDQ